MSRIGKVPIPIPAGVTITIAGQNVKAKGSLGELNRDLPKCIEVTQAGSEVVVKPRDEQRETMAMWGLSRTLVKNLIEGVSKGFEKKLKITGVGYKVAAKGKDLELQLGFSHPVPVKAPEGITFEIDPKKNTIVVKGLSKEVVGQVAANIRQHRPPEPYKGKGIAYEGEHIVRKAGKAAASAGAAK